MHCHLSRKRASTSDFHLIWFYFYFYLLSRRLHVSFAIFSISLSLKQENCLRIQMFPCSFLVSPPTHSLSLSHSLFFISVSYQLSPIPPPSLKVISFYPQSKYASACNHPECMRLVGQGSPFAIYSYFLVLCITTRWYNILFFLCLRIYMLVLMVTLMIFFCLFVQNQGKIKARPLLSFYALQIRIT